MTPRMFVFLFALSPLFSQGQTVRTEEESFRIQGENIHGHQVALSSTETDVSNALEKYLKIFGKNRKTDGVHMVAEPLIAGKKYGAALFATTRQVGGTTAAWFGMKDEATQTNTSANELEKIARDFGISFYKDQIQLQVDESLRALQTVEKQQTRLINQNRDLNNKIEGNKRKKIELEKSLVENKAELEDLAKRLDANLKAQDSVAVATGQIKKVVEMHQNRQKNVN